MDITLAALRSLLEAGRVLSAANEAKVRAAIAALEDVLNRLGGDAPATEADRLAASEAAADALVVCLMESETLLADALSGDYTPSDDDLAVVAAFLVGEGELDEATGPGNIGKLIKSFGKWAGGSQATCAKMMAGKVKDPDKLCAWMKDRSTGSTKWRGAESPFPVYAPPLVTYTTGNSTVTYSTPAEVAEADIELSGDVVPLVERAVRPDGSARVRIIQPGWGSSGFYSEAVLKRDGPRVFTRGLHMHLDHPTAREDVERPERSVSTLGGVLESDARWETGPDGPGLYADVKPLGAFKDHLDELAPHIGVSIRAMGKAKAGEADGRKGPIIESLLTAKSIDWVTSAGAGGKVMSLLESAQRGVAPPPPPPVSPPPHPKPEPESNPPEEETPMSEQALREAQTAIEALQERDKEKDALIARLTQSLATRDGEAFLREALSKVKLPEPSRERLFLRLADRMPLKDGEIDREALQEAVSREALIEANYLTSVGAGGGQVRGMGLTTDDAARERETKLAERENNIFHGRYGLSESGSRTARG